MDDQDAASEKKVPITFGLKHLLGGTVVAAVAFRINPVFGAVISGFLLWVAFCVTLLVTDSQGRMRYPWVFIAFASIMVGLLLLLLIMLLIGIPVFKTAVIMR